MRAAAPTQSRSRGRPSQAAAAMVTAGVPGIGSPLPPGGSGTDLVGETVNLILARVAFVASARVFVTAARIEPTLALIHRPPSPRRILPAGARRLYEAPGASSR